MLRQVKWGCLFAAMLLTIGCTHTDEKKWRIGISQCSNDDWRSEMNEEVCREMMFHDDAEVEIRSADDSNEKQIRDIRYFIDNGFDLIIAAPNEAIPITPVIREAYNKGIPVITFDRDIAGDSCYTAHLEVDNTALGRSAACYALNIIPRPARIIEIQGIEGMTPTQKRHKGFTDEINRHAGVQVVASVFGNWDERRTAELADSLLDIYPDIDLIYAHNDRMAISASRVARGKGLHDIRFLGIDGTANIGIRAVADGVIDATFLYPTEGSRLIRTAMAILKKEPFKREEKVAPLSPVDKTNADILLQQKALQNSEIEKIKILRSELDDYWKQHSAQSILLYAAIAIVVLFFGVFFLLMRIFWQYKKHRAVLEQQNRQLEEQRDRQKELYRQLDQATQSKLVFFTNVSHDLRTPLTLIAEPVEQLLEHGGSSPEQRHTLLAMAHKNIKILQRLINQILDFRKYESGKMVPDLAEVDVPVLIREWVSAFLPVARKRHIRLTHDIVDGGNFTMAFDCEKMERVFFNLMSNAFKFTPDNGDIHIVCRCDADSMELSVRDNGVGISEADLPKIFDQFYQVDKVHSNGSGIGLALTKAFVELHDGVISVSSKPGEGTQFTVRIPVRHVENKWNGPAIVINEKEIAAELDKDEINLDVYAADVNKNTVLVIDDNYDIRKLITEVLGPSYNILTAKDGQQGLKLAAKYTPDLIICDVMMPVMDGLECCRLIKGEISTSHIPVLMLTACSMDEQRVAGYESGADSYLSKPFNGTVLAARCRNLIENRKRIRDIYRDKGSSYILSKDDDSRKPAKMPGDIDSDFYNRFVDIVNEELGNSDLNIDYVAGRMGLGQSQFSRKIKSLTNFTPVELVRTMRLKKARTLLATTEMTMGEITYEIGFTSPAYFSKCFKDAYGETPSDLRTRLSAGK